MLDQKLIWLSSLVAVEIMLSGSVVAQTNQSDTTGGQTYSSPAVSIDSINGNGISPSTQFNPTTGEVQGGGITTPIKVGTGTASDGELGNDSPKNTAEGNGSQPREVTLNDVAEALETGLEQSSDSLATAESSAKVADAAPRRIARKSGVLDEELRACVNPVKQARDAVNKQLFESEKFIKQVNQIEPQKNIW